MGRIICVENVQKCWLMHMTGWTGVRTEMKRSLADDAVSIATGRI